MFFEGLRSIFFGDQDIYEEDLNNIEYTKLKTIRDSLAACIKQPGVAIDSLAENGLKVSGSIVNPGTAIDKYGRLIYVPSSTAASGSVSSDPYYHPSWPSRTVSGSGDYINIYYAVQYDISENNDSDVAYYTRAYDSYEILAEASPPSENSGGLCLASGGTDCRPLLLPRGATGAASMIDEVWLIAGTGGANLWTGGPPEVKREVAQIAYKHLGGAYLNILFQIQVTGALFDGTFYVKLYNSLTGALIISDYLSFGAGDSGYYTISLPISSLSTASLYYIALSYGVFSISGTMRIKDVSIYVT